MGVDSLICIVRNSNATSSSSQKVSKIIEQDFGEPLPKNTYLLTKLLEIGRLKLKVAVRKDGDYHEKIGFFEAS